MSEVHKPVASTEQTLKYLFGNYKCKTEVLEMFDANGSRYEFEVREPTIGQAQEISNRSFDTIGEKQVYNRTAQEFECLLALVYYPKTNTPVFERAQYESYTNLPVSAPIRILGALAIAFYVGVANIDEKKLSGKTEKNSSSST